MKPEDEKNHPDVVIPKVWELIVDQDGQPRTYLISKEVSHYIRGLERDVNSLNELLASKIKEVNMLQANIQKQTTNP